MKRTLILLILLLLAIPTFAATFGNGHGGPSSTNNDDTCDIAVMPAATLLLPYFEVDQNYRPTTTTVFTITNVTNVDQIARVTLWTDFSYPVLSFNVYLTGYDVEELNLFDILVRGIIAPDRGTGTEVTDRGPLSDTNTTIDLSNCDRLPGALDPIYIERMQSAFLLGVVPPLGRTAGCAPAGNVHQNAIGYATVDVVGNCRFFQPDQTEYYTQDIRYDNVLTGDYQQINQQSSYEQANPLVHIRAMPEGGTPASRQHGAHNKTNFERTFYDRYAPSTHSDARQPLPALFHARWRQGGPFETQTDYKIWREGNTGANAACSSYASNAILPAREVVVFDDAENFVAGTLSTPETARVPLVGAGLPQMTNGATEGWTYFNLDTTAGDGKATQNWVVVSMRSEAGYGGDFDATVLGNGCTPETGSTEASAGAGTIGPAPNTNP